MKTLNLLLCAAFGIVLPGAAEASEERFLTLCRAAIEERLLAPSTFTQIEARSTIRQATLREFVEELHRSDHEQIAVSEEEAEGFRDYAPDPTAYRSYITYDASNAFGVPIRRKSVCEYTAPEPTLAQVSAFAIRINGRNYTDWLRDGEERQ